MYVCMCVYVWIRLIEALMFGINKRSRPPWCGGAGPAGSIAHPALSDDAGAAAVGKGGHAAR